MTRAVILAGGGDLSDPWHPFAATSRLLAELLASEGLAARVVDTVAGLEQAATEAQLLVLNAGSGIETTPHDAALLEIVEAHLAAGQALLALHIAVGLLPGSAAWEHALGGCWVPGVSGHPPIGEARVQLEGHDLVEGLDEVRVVDERYTGLRVAADATVFAWHEEDGTRQPIAWTRSPHARVVCDTLGHDERSYASESRRALLRAEVRWLVSGGGAGATRPAH